MSDNQNSDAQEKSHDPTPSRLEKARRDGDVAQSKEVNAAAGYLGFYLALALTAMSVASGLSFGLARLLYEPGAFASAAFGSPSNSFIFSLSSEILKITSPFFLLPAICVLGALLAQRAIVVAPSKIKPKFSKLSVISNAKKKFGPEGLSEFAKSATKLLIVFTLFGVFFTQRLSSLPSDALLPAQALPQGLLKEGVVFVGVILLFSSAVAAIDLPWSQHQYIKRIKMTHEEIKKESKENEGNPEIKQNRRARAQSIANNKMLSGVPQSDVIIVNPTHYAVALSWDRKGRAAPVCVAKGTDFIAARIREIGAASGVPIQRDPLTARAIHATVDIGDEIRKDHYAAVAAAIHFADTVRKKAPA